MVIIIIQNMFTLIGDFFVLLTCWLIYIFDPKMTGTWHSNWISSANSVAIVEISKV